MKTLYQIEAAYQQLEEQLIEAGGEITPEQADRLAILTEQELPAKAEGYVKIIKTWEAEVKAIDEEIKRLQNLKKTRQNAKKRLTEALSQALRTFGLSKLKAGLFALSFRKSEQVVINVPAEELPKDCQIVKIEPLSKSELKQKLKAGQSIPGVELVENQNLQIR